MIAVEEKKSEVSSRDKLSMIKAYCKAKEPLIVVTTAGIVFVASLALLGWYTAYFVLNRTDGEWGKWMSY